MIKIRLSRAGAKNSPFSRIVAVDSKRKNTGSSLDILGYYDPVKKHFELNDEKLKKWVGLGAQISHGVKKLMTSK